MKAHHSNFLIVLKVLAIFEELLIFMISMISMISVISMISMILMSMVLRNCNLRKSMGEVVDGV